MNLKTKEKDANPQVEGTNLLIESIKQGKYQYADKQGAEFK